MLPIGSTESTIDAIANRLQRTGPSARVSESGSGEGIVEGIASVFMVCSAPVAAQ